MIDLNALGRIMRQWQDVNFQPDKVRAALQLCEEAGEVARAIGKEKDGIRSRSRGVVADELADVILCATALAHRCDIELYQAIERRLQRCLSLDFVKYPEDGTRS